MALIAASGANAAEEGFYGGLTVRPSSPEASPLGVGDLPSAWTKLTPGVKSEPAGGTLLYGGYRFQSAPLGLEAAISNTGDASRVGLRLDPRALGFHPDDTQPRNWNVDVFTNLAVHPSVALYGRMGYGYNDAVRNNALTGVSNLAPQDSIMRRARDGFNYGVGFRYDMNTSLGLRLEWSRFARFGSEAFANNQPPENDQLSIGVQYRF